MVISEAEISLSCPMCEAVFPVRVPILLATPETEEALERALAARCSCGARVPVGQSFVILRPELVLPYLFVIGVEEPEARADVLEAVLEVAREYLGGEYHPAMVANGFAVAVDQVREALRPSPPRGHRRWLGPFMELHGAQSEQEVAAAFRAFAPAGSSALQAEEALQTLEELRAAARSRGDQQRVDELLADREMLRFAWQHGVPALEDNLLRRWPAPLSPFVEDLIRLQPEANRDDGQNASIDAATRIIRHPDFEAASAAFRRAALTDLATMQQGRYQVTGEVRDLDEAKALLARAVALASPFSPEDRGTTLNKLAIAHLRSFDLTGRREDLDQAISTLLDALKQSEPWPSAGRSRANLGIALRKRGMLTRSTADIDLAIDVLTRAAADGSGASALLNLANALRSRYSLHGNIADLERAVEYLKVAAQVTPDSDEEYQHVLAELGSALVRRNQVRRNAPDLTAAIDVLTEAIRRARPGSPAQRSVAQRLSEAFESRYEYTGDLKDIKALFLLREQVLAASPAGTTEEVEAMFSLGKAWLLRFKRRSEGGAAERAEALFRAVLARSPSPSAMHSDAQLALIHLGWTERTAGTSRSARGSDGLRRIARDAAEHAFTPAQAASAAELWSSVAIADARWLAASEDVAAPEVWNEAAEAAVRALEAEERLADAQPDRRRLALALRTSQGLAAQVALACAKTGRLADAVTALERGRARLLSRGWESARRRLAPLLEGEHRDLAARYLGVAEEVATIERELGVPNPQPATVGELFDQRIRREDLEERLRRRQHDLDAAAEAVRVLPGLADFQKAPSFEQVQAFVREAGLPVVYVTVTGHETLALVVRKTSIEPLWLNATGADVDRLLVERRPWSELTPDERMDLHEDQAFSVQYADVRGVLGPGEELSPFGATVDRPMKRAGVVGGLLAGQLGWVPLPAAVATVLRDVETLFAGLASIPEPSLFLVPCGALALLPIHAALRDKTVRHAVSITSLPPRPASSVIRGPVKAVGDPQPVRPALRWAREEARIVRAGFDRGELLTGEQATRDAVLTDLAETSVLHLACHGSYDAHDPLASKLLLGGETALTAREVADLRLSHLQLAVLSACRTATTDTTHLPDESLSLTAAFLGAGVPSVIGTLWQVDDRATGALMGEFYRLCRGGRSPADALHAAADWLARTERDSIDRVTVEMAEASGRELPVAGGHDASASGIDGGDGQAPYSAPVYWAPFVAYGW